MLIVNLVLKKIHIKLKIIPEVTGTDRILRSKAMRRTNNFELTQNQEEQIAIRIRQDLLQLIQEDIYFYVTLWRNY